MSRLFLIVILIGFLGTAYMQADNGNPKTAVASVLLAIANAILLS